MDVDMFKPRTLTEAILKIRPTNTFFLDRFFGRTLTHNTLAIDVDVWKGKRKVAPYSRVGSKSTPLERQAFTTTPMNIPYIKLSRSLEPVQCLLRTPGEAIYSSRTPADRAREQLAMDLEDLNNAIKRAEELQAAQALVNGVAIIKGEEIDAEADYGRSGSHAYTVSTLWTAAGSDPGADLDAAALRISKDSGLTANVAVMGASALAAFLKHDLVRDQLDTANGFYGSINADKPAFNGATYYGRFRGLEIWGYNEWYLDDADNTEKPLVPVDKVLVASTQARNWRHYGPIMHMGSLIAEQRFVYSWKQEDPSCMMMAVHAAPLMVPHDVDATCLLDVVA